MRLDRVRIVYSKNVALSFRCREDKECSMIKVFEQFCDRFSYCTECVFVFTQYTFCVKEIENDIG